MKHFIASVLSFLFRSYYCLRYRGRVSFGKGVILNHRFRLKGRGKVIIGNNVNLWAHAEPNQFHFYGSQGVIEIGDGTRLNGIFCHCESRITIGQKCLIGSAILMDTDFHTFDDPTHILHGRPKTKPIAIGDQVWLGGQCAILKGVSIGEKSVVGFRSVVSKSFEDNVVVAGNPASVVKSRS